ncbi:MAG: CDF family cation efflux protein [Roseibaca calidilacus]|uniref:CDF family cation efflux protein n=1 Tax=Roseibaca calidilacus TaxID=1666912 RepID=A0A0P7YNY9_9RHOB|nr:cation diffusion facilitator family transporter [Roseibaca calidilacus]KPP90491.1 MAG: CDF family cation efflux protein [Roseibaca calidilacus]CUX83301.1 cation diffusion facilitator family transporter [Roseibaca calidilacus]
MTMDNAKTRVTLVGAGVNIILSTAKIGAGVVLASPALVADGVHSLSDLVSDVLVLWALRHSGRAPDEDHPYGHGRFETLATLALSAVLALTGLGIAWDAALRLLSGADSAPGVWALAVIALSIVTKEILFHYTKGVGEREASRMIVANAWHHRTDALSSVVALVGVGAAQLGFGWGDPLAAIIIAAMLARVAWEFGKGAVDELVDTQAPDNLRADLQDSLSRTPGVQGLRDLRMRQHGARAVADVSVMVDPHITVTEGHRIAEAARADALGQIDALEDLIIHVEPAGHFDGFGATKAPLRGEIEGLILTLAQAHPMVAKVARVQLGYFEDGLHIEVLAGLHAHADHAATEAELTDTLRQTLPELRALSLHRQAGLHG